MFEGKFATSVIKVHHLQHMRMSIVISIRLSIPCIYSSYIYIYAIVISYYVSLYILHIHTRVAAHSGQALPYMFEIYLNNLRMSEMRRYMFSRFFPRASERRVLLILVVGVCYTFSHLHIFTSTHIIFTSAHIIFASSHLHIPSSHLHIIPSHIIFTSSHLQISSSHPHILSSHIIFTSSHLILTYHLHIFTSSLSLSPSLSLPLPLSLVLCHGLSPSFSDEIRFDRQKLW